MVMLGRELVHAVEGERTGQPGLGYGHLFGRPIHEARAGKDDGRRVGQMATRLEERELAAEVDVEVLERLEVAAGRARVAREVEDHGSALDGPVHQSPIPQITLEVAPTLPSPRGGGRISRAAQRADVCAG